jgi:chemotaxis protein MotB
MAHGRGRRRKGHGEAHAENHERWLITYADLITLLMVFFIVLYSMANADQEKFKKVSAALNQAFNVDVLSGSGASSMLEGSPEAKAQIDDLISSAEVPEVTRLKNKIESILNATDAATPEVSIGQDKEGVVIRMSGSYLFDSGRAELKPNSLALLDAIAMEVKLLPNDIRVDGHTDSTPIDSPRYPTNWELSTARALAVTRYFTETSGIRADRLMAAGFGEFRPLAPNDTRERRAANRRVEIKILSQSVDDGVTALSTLEANTAAQEH